MRFLVSPCLGADGSKRDWQIVDESELRKMLNEKQFKILENRHVAVRIWILNEEHKYPMETNVNYLGDGWHVSCFYSGKDYMKEE